MTKSQCPPLPQPNDDHWQQHQGFSDECVVYRPSLSRISRGGLFPVARHVGYRHDLTPNSMWELIPPPKCTIALCCDEWNMVEQPSRQLERSI